MGHGNKIRAPHIARLKVFSPKAQAITAKPIFKHTGASRLSHRYGSKIRSRRMVLPKLFQGNPSKGLTNKAKLFGKPKDLVPVKGPANPSSNMAKIIPGFGGPMMVGMVFMGLWDKKPKNREPKQLPSSSEESSSKALVVRKKEFEALAVRKTEIKAIDGSEKTIFKVDSTGESIRKFFRDPYMKPLALANGVIWTPLLLFTPLGFMNLLTAALGQFLFFGGRAVVSNQDLKAGWRGRQNTKKIEKLREGKIRELDINDINIYQELSEHPEWSLELLAARALKDAPPKKVEAWMNEMFGDNLPAKLQWIRRGKVRGGSQLHMDL